MAGAESSAVWILGATGRTGRAIAARLSERSDVTVVAVGRSASRLASLQAAMPHPVRVEALATAELMAEAIGRERPRLVINLMGEYAATGPLIARACMPGGAYMDLANDMRAIGAVLAMNDEAAAAGSALVTAAGFGVVATEAVVARLCAGQPVPRRVRVDALASWASEGGMVGEAFAATTLSVITSGGRVYRDGRIVPTRLGSNVQRLRLPDGTSIVSGAVPTGELIAARAASGAPDVDVTSGLAPTAPAIRAMLPLLTVLLRSDLFRGFLLRLIARQKTTAAPRPRPHSWGHAVVEWSDGRSAESWLRADDAMDYTAEVLLAVASRVLGGSAPAGAYTPASGLGADIATDAGAAFID
jgi:short subunit dehydrogenase-like uncharacterized protein